jgi:Na+/melibiose symporter-like transporter
VLAILFIGPFKDPVKNKWVIQFGIVACILIIPFALIAGHFRDMPFWWRLVDCSFGIIGLLPLMICLKNIKRLEIEEKEKSERKESFDLLMLNI